LKLTILFVKFQVWWQKTSNSPHFFPHQSMYAMPNHLTIICQNLIIWKLLLSAIKSFERHDHWKMEMAHCGG
jgi:hypothetical protein